MSAVLEVSHADTYRHGEINAHSFLTFHWKGAKNVVDPHFTTAVNCVHGILSSTAIQINITTQRSFVSHVFIIQNVSFMVAFTGIKMILKLAYFSENHSILPIHTS